MGRAGNKKEKEDENGRSKESSRGIGDLEWRRESSKISKKVGARKVSPMDKSLWKETIWENANEKGVEPCNRGKRRICAKKEEDVPIVKRGKRGSKGVYKEAAEKGVYLTVQITTDSTGIFCREEGWKEVHGARLQVFKWVNDKEQLPAPSNIGCLEKHWDKEGCCSNH